jgi:hypothetical protein
MHSAPATHDSEAVALQFARALARHDYAGALAMTSRSYRTQTGVERLRRQFEDAFSEAVTVVTTREDGGLRVQPLEFGRP